MTSHRELSADELRDVCNPDDLGFVSTADIETLESIIGQNKAVRAMLFGLRMRKHGYNVFITGLTGTGRSSYARSVVEEYAQNGDVPFDWCYVYNFKEPDKPRAIQLPAGHGEVFTVDMCKFVEMVKQEIPKAFSTDKYEEEQKALFSKYQSMIDILTEELQERARNHGFVLQRTSSGLVNIPLVSGKPINPEEFEELTKDEKEVLEKKARALNDESTVIIRRMKQLEAELKNELQELNRRVGFASVDYYLQNLTEKYRDYYDIAVYLQELATDLKERVEEFRKIESEEDSNKGNVELDTTIRYQVNLLVSNSETTGAPVVYETNPTYYNLLGRIEYRNAMGLLSTDFTRIRPGALHKANGGYLIIHARDLLSNPHSWRGLKRALKNNYLAIENVGQESGYAITATLRPQEVPLDVKVIVIGNAWLHQMLYQNDEDFRKLFKVVAQFDVQMDRNQENISKLSRFIKTHCDKEGLLHFDSSAVARIVEYSSRLSNSRNKLTTRFNEIVEILYEADAWSEMSGSDVVQLDHVEKAILEKRRRSNLYETRLFEMINEGTVLIETSGNKVGQINGLAVIQMGKYAFGKPMRITVTTYAGKNEIVNIEREVNHSGSIHDKGVLTLIGYLGQKFAQEVPLSLSVSINFEQLYHGIDGDSASSAELYALLSSLAEIPIKQGIAVTGSVNQWGEIQPVGGVNEKIEGYYRVCKLQGLTGEQGVIIPAKNTLNLMLSYDVIEAVKRGEFHIYPVTTVDEGIEILTELPAAVLNENECYENNTVYGKVLKKLTKFAELSKLWAGKGNR